MYYKDYKKKVYKNKVSCKKKKKYYNKKLYFILLIVAGIYILFNSTTPNTIPNKHKKPIKTKITKKWKYIVIHHSATKEGNAKAFNRFHKHKYNNKLLYHFVIGNGKGSPDGKPEIGYRWKTQKAGGHVVAKVDKYNQYGIGICLVGNFNNNPPTKKQIEMLIKLTKFLMNRFDIMPENVILHKDANETDCPGKQFPYKKFKSEINNFFKDKVYSATKLNLHNHIE